MKKILFCFIFCWLFNVVGDSEIVKNRNLIKWQMVNDYQKKVNAFLHAVRIVESGLNDYAVGAAGDIGPLQITKIRLEDYNQRTGKNYTTQDCFSWEVSKEIFLFYAHKIGFIPDNIEELARRWNRSSLWQDEKGLQYWSKVQKHLNI